MKKDIKINLCNAAETEIDKGLSLISGSFKNNIEKSFWIWADETSGIKPSMILAKHEGEIIGTVIFYPRYNFLQNKIIQNPSFAGQLCIKKGFRNQGLGFELITYGENILRDHGISFFCSGGGKGLFKKYYRKNFAFAELASCHSCFTYHNPGDYLDKFCEKVNKMDIRWHSLTVIEVEEPVFGNVFLMLGDQDCEIRDNCTQKPDLVLKGPVWLIFKFAVSRTGKRMMAMELLKRSFSIGGWSSHPVKAVQFIKLLVKVALK